MGFINSVSNMPKTGALAPGTAKSPSKPKSKPMSMPKISPQQLAAIGLIILGLIFVGIAIMTW